MLLKNKVDTIYFTTVLQSLLIPEPPIVTEMVLFHCCRYIN